MTSPFQTIGIAGAGAWGTALAITLARAGRSVTLWARGEEFASNLNQNRENVTYLPGVPLLANVVVTHDLRVLQSSHALILATPAQYLRALCKDIALLALPPRPLIIAAKGIELTTHRLMSEVVTQELPGHPVFVLSGPSLAHEVARDLPAALTLASEAPAGDLARALSSPTFRLYTTDDIIGTQIGGSIKNVLAIACGIVTGRQLGDNARAALITRGLAEMMRLGNACGARAETLTGLSGLGDLVLTACSMSSRNTSLGIALGQGKKLTDILAARHGVAEGNTTAAAALGLAYRHGIDMPVMSAVDRILREQASIDEVIVDLMSRPLRQEAA